MSVQFDPDARQIIGVASGEAPRNPPTSAAQFVEVEVDTETGQVRVLKVVTVHDIGQTINLNNVEGQIYGAVQQGLGYALTEQMVLEQGKVQNPSFSDYKMLSAPDMPKIDIVLIEKPDPVGPFGAKGVGEPPIIPTAAAIANAVYDAVGVRIRDLPITQEKVLRALAEQAATQRPSTEARQSPTEHVSA